eukprot:bmy_17053T0
MLFEAFSLQLFKRSGETFKPVCHQKFLLLFHEENTSRGKVHQERKFYHVHKKHLSLTEGERRCLPPKVHVEKMRLPSSVCGEGSKPRESAPEWVELTKMCAFETPQIPAGKRSKARTAPGSLQYFSEVINPLYYQHANMCKHHRKKKFQESLFYSEMMFPPLDQCLKNKSLMTQSFCFLFWNLPILHTFTLYPIKNFHLGKHKILKLIYRHNFSAQYTKRSHIFVQRNLKGKRLNHLHEFLTCIMVTVGSILGGSGIGETEIKNIHTRELINFLEKLLNVIFNLFDLPRDPGYTVITASCHLRGRRDSQEGPGDQAPPGGELFKACKAKRGA